MLLDARSRDEPLRATPVVVAPVPPARGERDREALLEELNRAVRRPEESGGLAHIARLLDELAAGEPGAADAVWIPDTNVRLGGATMMRGAFPDADVPVIASQYGEDAHRRGWLRLDRTLTAGELAHVVDNAVRWARTDRALRDVLGTFGPPSVVFGSPEPHLPKTLSYAGEDRTEPVVAFHLGSAQTTPSPEREDPADAVLLAVRVRDAFLGGWEFTPTGEDRCAP